ncbi:MAG TPA: hypothetical protein VFB45_19135 [Pseudolabrys sp.]|nr:hypothetical protein [Pseudolabrys sp.]
MSTVIPISRHAAFEPELTQAMAAAFERACRELRRLGRDGLSDETVAKTIIEFAQRGERDPARMQAHALRVLGAAE